MTTTMSTDDLRLKFLKEAAQLLCTSSPTTAATLGVARRKLLEEQIVTIDAASKEWDEFRRQACGACGNLILPGWTFEITQESRPSKPIKEAKEGISKPQTREKDMVYSCLTCNRKTLQPLPFEPRRSRVSRRSSTKNKPLSVLDKPSLGDNNKVIKTTNASSKQRAKARKGGLQAMLAQSKQSSAPKGLDLMDFL